MAKRMTKEEKRIESEVHAAFKKHGSNRQFDIFDLAKITTAGTNAGIKGENIEEAVKAACDQYEKKS